jgi:hypothetical protein
MRAQNKAHHSPVGVAGKTRPTRKSRAAAKRAQRPALQKAKDAIADVGGKAVKTVKTLAHKGEELVSKAFGGKKRKSQAGGKSPGRRNAKK